MKKSLANFLIVIIFLVLLFFIHQPQGDVSYYVNNIKYVKIAGQNIKVDLALTSVEQAKGLSGRMDLKNNEGMLFIFPQSGNYPFWMKDMNFPIDIIWLAPPELGGEGSKAKVIYIKKDARPASPELQRGEPESYLEIYSPKNEQGESLLSKYVLEVVSGFADRNNLQVGDEVEFIY